MKCDPDFITTYNRLFVFLKERGALNEFWPFLSDALLRELRDLIRTKGIVGMLEYWTGTLTAEGADCTLIANIKGGQSSFEIIMKKCPSLLALDSKEKIGFDYCLHCRKIYNLALSPLGYSFEQIGFNGGCVIRIKSCPTKNL